MKQSGRRKRCLPGLLEAMKTMVKFFLCDRVTLAGHPFQPSLRSSSFILSVSDGSEWWSWRRMPRLINTCSFSVFPCSLCLRSGEEGKAGNAGFLLSPPFSFFSLSSFISLFPFVLSVFLCVVLCFFLFVFLWYSLSILSLLVFLWFSPPLVRGLLWLL
jgi:hypothetical protein